jgi:DNA-binding transcriptional ArsR family regulator
MRMLRLRFGVDDLARTRFAAPGLFCELAGSVQALQQPASPLRKLWHGTRTRVPLQVSPLLELVPAHGSLPGFLIPELAGSGFDETLDVIQATPRSQLRSELAEAHPSPAHLPWVRDLAVGQRDSFDELEQAVRSYHGQVLDALLPALHNATAAELNRRVWQVATGGIEAALSTLHPLISWRDGVLEVGFPTNADVDLGGRGLCLCASAAWTRPGFAFHWTEQPCLVYPILAPDWDPYLHHDDREARLAQLLGTTRARILCALTGEHTTTSLAATLGLSLSSASVHTSVLRGARLVTTRRDGQAVRHTLTDLGRQLVSASVSSGSAFREVLSSGPGRAAVEHAKVGGRSATGS